MSIYDELESLAQEQRLILLSLAVPLHVYSSSVQRKMYLSREVNKLFTGPPWSEPGEERCNVLRADLEHFVAGKQLTVSTGPKSDPQLKQLDPPLDEIWAIRSRAPRPGIRVLGRFAVKDVFIALTWHFRKDLREDREWRDACVRCKTEWRKLFPAYDPISGKFPSDYASNLVPI